jgi:hypothetical protein
MSVQAIKLRFTAGELVDLASGRVVEIGRDNDTGIHWVV